MANRFELSGILNRLVPVRGYDESGMRDAYIETDDAGRLRVRLSSIQLIERAREHLHEQVVVTGRLTPAGVHQGPRLVEVMLAIADTLVPVRDAGVGHDPNGDGLDLEDGANEDVENSWFDADELLVFVSSQGLDSATLTHEQLRELVLEYIANSPRVLGRAGDRAPDDVLAFLTATLIGEPWFEHAISELLGHVLEAATSDREVVEKGVVG